MSAKKDAALDALMNLHFADRASAAAALDHLFDAFMEIEEERYIARQQDRAPEPAPEHEPALATEPAADAAAAADEHMPAADTGDGPQEP